MTEKITDMPAEELEIATFYIGDALCGINILSIQEINKDFHITDVPHSPDYITGIINLRGSIVTTINLGKKLGLDPVIKHKDNRNIIVNSEDEHVGLLVDSISDVIHTRSAELEPAPSNIGGAKGKYFQGILKTGNQLVGILDIDQLLKE